MKEGKEEIGLIRLLTRTVGCEGGGVCLDWMGEFYYGRGGKWVSPVRQ